MNTAVTTFGVGFQPFASTDFLAVTAQTPLGAFVYPRGSSIGPAVITNRDTTPGSAYTAASKVEIVLSFASVTTDISGTEFVFSYDCGALQFGPLATAATGGGCTFGAPMAQHVRIGCAAGYTLSGGVCISDAGGGCATCDAATQTQVAAISCAMTICQCKAGYQQVSTMPGAASCRACCACCKLTSLPSPAWSHSLARRTWASASCTGVRCGTRSGASSRLACAQFSMMVRMLSTAR
jgi:hypothetical protein